MTPNVKPLILLVEDDEDFREAVREQLVDNGYDVIEAGSFMEAYSKMARAKPMPDLVLTDYFMPGNGVNVVKLCVQMELPVIMMSHTPEFARQELDQEGLESYPVLSKRLGIEVFLDAIQSNL